MPISHVYWKKSKLRFTPRTVADIIGAKGCSKKRAPKRSDYVLNWGISEYPEWGDDVNFINNPYKVSNASDKRATLKTLDEFNIPIIRYTSSLDEVYNWLETGKIVLARTLTRSSKGKGIKIISDESEIITAPLYTRYYGKTHEFRVHVVGGQVIDYIQKKKRQEVDNNIAIRTFSNGWVFAHHDILEYDEIKEMCVNAVTCLNLHFGAVDVLANVDKETKQLKNFVICEVNSAPGLSSPTTLGRYINAFQNL